MNKIINGKNIYLVLILLTLVFFGFLRDFIFVNINGQLHITYYHSEQVGISPLMHFIEKLSHPQLMMIKWSLTIIFSIIYLTIACFTIYIIFREKKYIKLTIFSYLIVFSISFIFMLSGYIFSSWNQRAYEFARYLMGMAQSPVIIMILIPAFKSMGNLTRQNTMDDKPSFQ